MAEKNIRMKVKTSSGYDILYPETKSEIVSFNKSSSNLNSDNVESAIKEVDKNLGLLSTLKTTIKTSIVNAINNLYDNTIGKTLYTLKEIESNSSKGYYVDSLAVKEISENLKPVIFLTSDNYTSLLQIGNLRGGRINNINGVKYGNVVTLYLQINDITAGGPDIEIFRFKNNEYAPNTYAVHSAFISSQNNLAYIGQFSDGHFTMSITGNGTISTSSKVTVLCTLTYIIV